VAYRVDQELNDSRQVIDDDQLKKMMNNQRQESFLRRNKYRMVTLVLIAINVVIFGIEILLSGGVRVSSQVLVDMGAMYAPYIQSPLDLYRFVTPMFLHFDVMHIAFNMFALFTVGGTLERVLGKGNFLLLYFIAGITGNVISYASVIFITGGNVVSAGASTSVFGLFVAVALLGVLAKGNRSFYLQYSKGIIAIIAINVAYTFLVPGISISGHLGGAFGGLLAMLMVPAKNLRVPNAVRILVSVLWVVAVVGLLIYQGIVAF